MIAGGEPDDSNVYNAYTLPDGVAYSLKQPLKSLCSQKKTLKQTLKLLTIKTSKT